jgi:hypothetical protein
MTAPPPEPADSPGHHHSVPTLRFNERVPGYIRSDVSWYIGAGREPIDAVEGAYKYFRKFIDTLKLVQLTIKPSAIQDNYTRKVCLQGVTLRSPWHEMSSQFIWHPMAIVDSPKFRRGVVHRSFSIWSHKARAGEHSDYSCAPRQTTAPSCAVSITVQPCAPDHID